MCGETEAASGLRDVGRCGGCIDYVGWKIAGKVECSCTD